MKRWKSIPELAPRINASVVSIGNFDGVHLGHRSIFEEVRRQSQRLSVESVAITFDPHPATVLGYSEPELLTTIDRRAGLIESLGIDHLVVQPFTESLARQSAADFIQEHLLGQLKMKILCIGPTTHLGHGREGTPEALRGFAVKMGFELSTAPILFVAGDMVSSTQIRDHVAAGSVRHASALLGYPYVTVGEVVTGASKGHELGFPTANLGHIATLLPQKGVYATTVRLGTNRWHGVTNVGIRPTLHDRSETVVETHLFDFSGDLLGKRVELAWVERLRDEVRFPSIEALQQQISRDVGAARKTLCGTPDKREKKG